MLPKLLAHRGHAKTHPENTLPAFADALRLGADGIELDVRLTGDGRLAVHHDPALGRIFQGSENVSDLPLSELRSRKPVLSPGLGACIPTLEEVLEFLRHSGPALLNIELKYERTGGGALEEKTAAAIRRFRFESRVFVSSFNHYGLVRIRKIHPGIPTGILYMEALFEPWEYAMKLGASALHPHYPAMSEDAVQRAQAAGLQVRPFTVNDPSVVREMARLGVDALITDDVPLCRQVFLL